MIRGHGGNIYELAHQLNCSPWDIKDMSSNINPLGPLPGLMAFLKENLHTIAALPEADASTVSRAFAESQQINPNFVIAGNGTTQFIYHIPRALGTQKALIIGPTYADYADSCTMNQVPFNWFMTHKEQQFQPNINRLEQEIAGYDTIFICNPNNPTSTLIPVDILEGLCWANPEKFFVIDESYMPFVDSSTDHSMIACGLSNVIVLHSLSKIFGIPGLRIGFIVSPVKTIDKFRNLYLPWSVNSLAQAAVTFLSSHVDQQQQFMDKTRAFLHNERQRIMDELSQMPSIQAFPSLTSFILLELQHITAAHLCQQLSASAILIRNCDNFNGLNDYFVRISLKMPQTNDLLIQRLRIELNNQQSIINGV